MKIKKIAVQLFIFLLAFSFCACGSEPPQASERTIVDPAGDEVTIPDEITGIICRVNTASYTAAMGKADLIKGTYKYMKNDKWASYLYPTLEDSVNLTGDPTAESFYDLDANLCIWSDREMNAALREQGISAITDLPEDMPKTVKVLAELYGNPELAEKWTAYYQKTLDEIKTRTDSITDKQVVYYVHGAGNKGIYHTAAGGTISETWILESGCKYATEGTVGFGIDITPEELIKIDPDVVVIGGIYYENMEKTFYEDVSLSELKAVKEGKIYHVPVGLIPWDQYGVEYPLLCLWTAKTVYPEAFADIDIAMETKAFYEQYCGVTLSDQDVNNLLNGKAPDGGSLLDER